MNYSYNNFSTPFSRNYQMPNHVQPQYVQQFPIQQMQQPAPQNMQTQMMQPMAQPVQQVMPIDTPIQYVGYATLKEAEAYILMPNTKGLFIDKTNGMVYEKVCAPDGQSFISHYKKFDINANKEAEEDKQIEADKIMPEFATKNDLNSFVTIEQHKEVMEALSCLKSQINDLKLKGEAKATTYCKNKMIAKSVKPDLEVNDVSAK